MSALTPCHWLTMSVVVDRRERWRGGWHNEQDSGGLLGNDFFSCSEEYAYTFGCRGWRARARAWTLSVYYLNSFHGLRLLRRANKFLCGVVLDAWICARKRTDEVDNVFKKYLEMLVLTIGFSRIITRIRTTTALFFHVWKQQKLFYG